MFIFVFISERTNKNTPEIFSLRERERFFTRDNNTKNIRSTLDTIRISYIILNIKYGNVWLYEIVTW